MKTFLSFFATLGCLLASSLVAYGQGETDNWYFGQFAGLNFSGANPVPLSNGALNTFEGVASISNPAGQILFYTDGIKVYNKLHQQMTNGFGLAGHPDATQSAIIAPQPGNDSIFYIFTVDYSTGNNGIRYSIVNINAGNGLGEVITKNVVLMPNNNTERITAVRHCNNVDVWIVTRQWNSDAYYSWLLTNTGLNIVPVISNVGNVVPVLPYIGVHSKLGYLKASPAGNKLAAQICAYAYIEFTDFNNSTGVVSNLIKIKAVPETFVAGPLNRNNYGVEFSPNGRYLYGNVSYSDNSSAMNANAAGIIYQYDVSTHDSTLIEQSRYLVDSFMTGNPIQTGLGGMQLAKNGKIYCTHIYSNKLSIIDQPNSIGSATGFSRYGLSLAANTIGMAGLPNFLQSYLYTNNTFSFTNSDNCTDSVISFIFNSPAAADSVRWDFGDPLTGGNNTAGSSSTVHTFSSRGSYTVKLIVYKKNYSSCESSTDTVVKTIAVFPKPTLLGNDTTLCQGFGTTLNDLNFSAGSSYLWNTGSTQPQLLVSTSGTYWLRKTISTCVTTDTINITVAPNHTLSLGPDETRCIADPLLLGPAHTPGATYQWSTGSTNAQITATTTGTYTLTKNVAGCVKKDTINLSFIPIPATYLGPDVVVCSANPIGLNDTAAFNPAFTYLWNTNANGPAISTATAGSFWLQKTLGSCTSADTVNVTIVPTIPLNIGPDQYPCQGSNVTLDAETSGTFGYSWNTGSTSPQISPTQSGIYIVTKTANGCSVSDSVSITFRPTPQIDLGADVKLCEGTAVKIFNSLSSSIQSTRTWSTGSTADTISVTQSGSYWLTLTANGCIASDTVNVQLNPNPVANLGPDKALCNGGQITLEAGNPGYSYTWSNGDTTQQIAISTPGTYRVTITDSIGCTDSDSVLVFRLDAPQVQLPSDTVLCINYTMLLQPQTRNAATYLWQDASSQPTLLVTAPGRYSLTVSNLCGSASDTMLVEYTDDCDIFLPNAFTPNGDGSNDVFRILGSTLSFDTYNLIVANRWGQIVFKTSQPANGWDGTFNGSPAEGGTYAYYLQYSRNGQIGKRVKKGSVHLFR